jgi:hypothetical protein
MSPSTCPWRWRSPAAWPDPCDPRTGSPLPPYSGTCHDRSTTHQRVRARAGRAATGGSR